MTQNLAGEGKVLVTLMLWKKVPERYSSLRPEKNFWNGVVVYAVTKIYLPIQSHTCFSNKKTLIILYAIKFSRVIRWVSVRLKTNVLDNSNVLTILIYNRWMSCQSMWWLLSTFTSIKFMFMSSIPIHSCTRWKCFILTATQYNCLQQKFRNTIFYEWKKRGKLFFTHDHYS